MARGPGAGELVIYAFAGSAGADIVSGPEACFRVEATSIRPASLFEASKLGLFWVGLLSEAGPVSGSSPSINGDSRVLVKITTCHVHLSHNFRSDFFGKRISRTRQF